MIRWIAIICLVFACGLIPSARAEEHAGSLPEIVALNVGFDGHYKVGLWVPVEVVLRGTGEGETAGRVSLTIPDCEGVASMVSVPADQPCRVSSGEETHVVLYARFGRVNSEAKVTFTTEDGSVVEKRFRSSSNSGKNTYPPALTADRKLVLCFATSPIGIEEAVTSLGYQEDRSPVVVCLEDMATLPTQWYGYEGVDAVVVAAGQPEIAQQHIADGEPRAVAFARWIQLGGRLFVVKNTEKALSEMVESWFAPYMPDSWKSASRTTSIDKVLRTERGFGQVVLLNIDPTKPPWGHASDRGKFYANLLSWSNPAEESSTMTAVASHLGFSDISGQLRGALDRFTGVSMVPFGIVVAVILLYIILIGPVDYWVLARIKRLSWTWITFPVVAIVFSVGAYGAAYWLKGNKIQINQVELVDVDAASGMVRATHWSDLYSPRVDTYNLSLRPRLADNAMVDGKTPILAWLGLPGSGLGGMDPKTVNPSPWRVAYRFSPALERIEGLPMQTWSTRSFTGRWSTTWKRELNTRLVRRDDEPRGRLTNPLDVELHDCMFVYDHWVYDLGTLGPGETISLNALPERTELRTLLTGSHKVFDEKSDRMERRTNIYDARSVDVAYILRMMMFFEHAGGHRYTNLSNEYQSFVDLSYMLGPNRAMLIGSTDARAAVLCRDDVPLDTDDDRHQTLYRFVFPVEEPTLPKN